MRLWCHQKFLLKQRGDTYSDLGLPWDRSRAASPRPHTTQSFKTVNALTGRLVYIAVADHTHQLQEPPKACSYILLQGREKGYSTKAEFDDSASRKQLYDPHCPLSASPARITRHARTSALPRWATPKRMQRLLWRASWRWHTWRSGILTGQLSPHGPMQEVPGSLLLIQGQGPT